MGILIWHAQLQKLQRRALASLPQTIKLLLFFFYRLPVVVAMVMDAVYKLWITMSVMEIRMIVIATPTCRLSHAWHATVQE